ncbi:MAG: DUF4351 domain-containing protein [Verrucomicrobiia bacterium]
MTVPGKKPWASTCARCSSSAFPTWPLRLTGLSNPGFWTESKYAIHHEHRANGAKEGREEGRKEGRQEGWQECQIEMTLRLLRRRCGTLSPAIELKIRALSSESLTALADALLDFSGLEDLQRWLGSR